MRDLVIEHIQRIQTLGAALLIVGLVSLSHLVGIVTETNVTEGYRYANGLLGIQEAIERYNEYDESALAPVFLEAFPELSAMLHTNKLVDAQNMSQSYFGWSFFNGWKHSDALSHPNMSDQDEQRFIIQRDVVALDPGYTDMTEWHNKIVTKLDGARSADHILVVLERQTAFVVPRHDKLVEMLSSQHAGRPLSDIMPGTVRKKDGVYQCEFSLSFDEDQPDIDKFIDCQFLSLDDAGWKVHDSPPVTEIVTLVDVLSAWEQMAYGSMSYARFEFRGETAGSRAEELRKELVRKKPRQLAEVFGESGERLNEVAEKTALDEVLEIFSVNLSRSVGVILVPFIALGLFGAAMMHMVSIRDLAKGNHTRGEHCYLSLLLVLHHGRFSWLCRLIGFCMPVFVIAFWLVGEIVLYSRFRPYFQHWRLWSAAALLAITILMMWSMYRVCAQTLMAIEAKRALAQRDQKRQPPARPVGLDEMSGVLVELKPISAARRVLGRLKVYVPGSITHRRP